MSKEEDMPRRLIADELREWFDRYTMRKDVYDELTSIADRVDAEHEKALHEAYTKGYEDGVGMANAKDAQAEYLRGKNDGYDEGWDAGFASADDWLAQHEDAMVEHGWVRLPVDADGEHIHIGDVMEWCDSGETLTVEGIGSDVLFYIDGENAEWTAARNKRHHYEPTVEDVLRDFGVDIAHALDADPDATVPEATIAKYAAKLRLAGGDAE